MSWHAAACRLLPPAGDLLRRRDRGRVEPLGDDLRELGRKTASLPRRRTRAQARAVGARGPAAALAGAGVPRAAWSAGLVVVGPEEAPDAVVRPGRPRALDPTPPTSRCWPARCSPGGPLRRTDAAGRARRRRRRGRSRTLHPVGGTPDRERPGDRCVITAALPRRETWTTAAAGESLTDGGRPHGGKAETRLHQDSPPSPSRLHAWRLAGPGRPRWTGTARCGVHRRARHGPLSPLSAARPGSPSQPGTLSAGHSARTLNRPGHRPSSLRPGTGGPRSRSACPVAATGRRWPATVNDQVGMAGPVRH